MNHENLTRQIIGCAYTVHNKMGSGYLESVYEKCLMIELRKAGLAAISQHPIHVTYEGEPVGDFFADIFVEGKVIVELNAISQLATVQKVQLVHYLTSTGIDTGLLINFGSTSVDVKREVRKIQTQTGSQDQQDGNLSKPEK